MLLAEVMDKEPTLGFLWSYFLAIGTVGLVLATVRCWLSFCVLPLWALISLVHISELCDPFVGPAILAEAGEGYFLQSYAAMSLGLLLPLAGVLLRLTCLERSRSRLDHHREDL